MRAALLLLVGGCSFGMTSSPRPHKPCTTSDTAPIIDTVSAVALAAASVVVVVQSGEDYTTSDASAYATMTGVTAFIYTIAATRGWMNVRSCRDHDIELRHEARVAQQKKAQEGMWKLARQAAASARSGDCATVAGVDRALKQVDAEFHATVFVRDEAIARCLIARQQQAQPSSPSDPQPQPDTQVQPQPQPDTQPQPQPQPDTQVQPPPQPQPQQPAPSPPGLTPPTSAP
jgi:hypothetical protein